MPSSEPGAEPQWIGVDGGATSVKVGAARRGEHGWELAGLVRERTHRPVPGFQPVARVAAAASPPGELEQRAAARRVNDTAALVARFVKGAGGPSVLAVALPGEKTRDGRGVFWARNAARDHEFLDELEARLAQDRVRLAAPVFGLFSDADCAAYGEQIAAGGGLAGVRWGWYLGGGTGLAEACVLDGQVTPLSRLGAGVPRAWERAFSPRASFEDALSVRAINARAGGPAEERVLTSDAAHAALCEAVEALAEWVLVRTAGLQELSGVRAERVVVGQRLAQILRDPRCLFARELLQRALASKGLPHSGLVELSGLRAAGTLGAAACARAAFEAARG